MMEKRRNCHKITFRMESKRHKEAYELFLDSGCSTDFIVDCILFCERLKGISVDFKEVKEEPEVQETVQDPVQKSDYDSEVPDELLDFMDSF